MIEIAILHFLLSHPQAAASDVATIVKPGAVNAQQLNASLADFAIGVLQCYHHTARFEQVDVVRVPWEREGQYAADHSAVVQIKYAGLTRSQYVLTVALLSKGTAARAAVISDTARVPYSTKCSLERWVETRAPDTPK